MGRANTSLRVGYILFRVQTEWQCGEFYVDNDEVMTSNCSDQFSTTVSILMIWRKLFTLLCHPAWTIVVCCI